MIRQVLAVVMLAGFDWEWWERRRRERERRQEERLTRAQALILAEGNRADDAEVKASTLERATRLALELLEQARCLDVGETRRVSSLETARFTLQTALDVAGPRPRRAPARGVPLPLPAALTTHGAPPGTDPAAMQAALEGAPVPSAPAYARPVTLYSGGMGDFAVSLPPEAPTEPDHECTEGCEQLDEYLQYQCLYDPYGNEPGEYCDRHREPGSPFCKGHQEAGERALAIERERAAQEPDVIEVRGLRFQATLRGAAAAQLRRFLTNELCVPGQSPPGLRVDLSGLPPETTLGRVLADAQPGDIVHISVGYVANVSVLEPAPRCVAGGCPEPRRPGGALCAEHAREVAG